MVKGKYIYLKIIRRENYRYNDWENINNEKYGVNEVSEIVVLSGSPSILSRSERVLKYLGSILEERKFTVSYISVCDVPQGDLYEAKFDSPAVKRIVSLLENAQAVVIGSPVYKASYSGILKSLIDLLPQDILESKPVLPVMTGGSIAHLLAIEYTLKPLLATLKGKNTQGIFYLDSQIDRNATPPIIDKELVARTNKQLNYLIAEVNKQKSLQSSAL